VLGTINRQLLASVASAVADIISFLPAKWNGEVEAGQVAAHEAVVDARSEERAEDG